MHIRRRLILLALSSPVALPTHAFATHQATVFGPRVCRADPLVPDQDRALTLCAQIAQTGTVMTLIAIGPAGATCLGRVLSSPGQKPAHLVPNGELLHTIGLDGHLYWHWSAAISTQYGHQVDAVIACGKADSAASDQREVLFTLLS